jgi:D-beta-D-heptose 7-phosphate kinase/D-beta-D-heptose 1-phosphate adenosyltransferase
MKSKKSTKSKKSPRKQKIVAVSGGFDPVHIGHVRMFENARKLGDRLVVILNNDNWLKKKKGYTFMPESERLEVIKGFRAVDEVFLTLHQEEPTDMSVCAELRLLKPDIFANGGDRFQNNIPEVAVCDEIGAEMVFNIGHGGKVQSSSWLVDKLKSKGKK